MTGHDKILIQNNRQRVLIAGAAGFIGSALASRLAREGYEVLGIDLLTDYYDPEEKFARLRRDGFSFDTISYGETLKSATHASLRFMRSDICDVCILENIMETFRPGIVVNLAAQPGVRYSIDNPGPVVSSNITGFFNLLDASRRYGASHFVYASSSSVYGNDTPTPFSEDAECRRPLSVYAATKLADELLAAAYSSAYGLRTTGVRMFSVYGEWGRPDMAPLIFARAVRDGSPVQLFGGGMQTRDLTYIGDVVESLSRLLRLPGGKSENEVFNIGSGNPVTMIDLLSLLEQKMGRTVTRIITEAKNGEARGTFSDSSKLLGATGYRPSTPLETGVDRLIEWLFGRSGAIGHENVPVTDRYLNPN